jgi:hypothetical protein
MNDEAAEQPITSINGTVIGDEYTVLLRDGWLEFYHVDKGPPENRDTPDFSLRPEETEGLQAFLTLVRTQHTTPGVFTNAEALRKELLALDEAYNKLYDVPRARWHEDPRVLAYEQERQALEQRVPGFAIERAETLYGMQGITHAFIPKKATDQVPSEKSHGTNEPTL